MSFRFHDGTPVDFQGVEHSFALVLGCAPRSQDHGLQVGPPGMEDALYRAAAAAVAKAMLDEARQTPRPMGTPSIPDPDRDRADKPDHSKKILGLAVLVIAGASVWYYYTRRPPSLEYM